MDNPQPKDTKGIPWADHNETGSNPPDTRREEYGDEVPGEIKELEQSADSGSRATERPADDEGQVVDDDL